VAEIMVERENEERERRQKREKLGRKADFFFSNFEHDFHYAQAMKSILIYKC
jgi:hypothetical protein